MQIWLYERLNFIEPPVNVEKYSPKGLFGRRRIHKHETSHDWILTIADRRTQIRLTVPWWDIREMMCSETSPYIRISSLTVLTFSFPLRVLRPFGKRQVIPDCDTMTPDDKPMLQGIARNWERYWEKGPRTAATLHPEHLEMVSKHYLVWMIADSAYAMDSKVEKAYARLDSTC